MNERKSEVLVIDDSAESRTLVSVVLGRAGYSVATAGDAAQAVEELKSDGDKYAVILLDFKMPHDGVAMIDYLSENRTDVLARTVVFIPAVNRPIWESWRSRSTSMTCSRP